MRVSILSTQNTLPQWTVTFSQPGTQRWVTWRLTQLNQTVLKKQADGKKDFVNSTWGSALFTTLTPATHCARAHTHTHTHSQ